MTFCLDSIIIKPENGVEIKNAIILLHGYGGDGKDISMLSLNWKRHMPNTVFICPNGHEPCAINPSGYQWFDLTKEDSDYILEQSIKAEEVLKKFINEIKKEFKLSRDGLCHIGNAKLSGNQTIKRVYHAKGKAPTLTTMGGGHREPKVYTGDMKFRKLTVRECERLQTFPDDYCDGVSRTQAYKMLGNSFTVEMIKCILSPIVKEQQK